MTLVQGSTRDLWLLRSLEGMSAKRAGFRSQAAQIDPAFYHRGNTSDRWRLRIDSYSWALRGTCRTAVSSGTNAVRGCLTGKRLPWVGSGRRTSPASLSQSAVLYHGNGWRATAIRLVGPFKMWRFRNLGNARTPTSWTRHHAQITRMIAQRGKAPSCCDCRRSTDEDP